MLIKNAEALERMEKVDTLVVDKNGTLTKGKVPSGKWLEFVWRDLRQHEVIRSSGEVN